MLHGLAVLPLPPRPPSIKRHNTKGSSKPVERKETAPAVSVKAKDGKRQQKAEEEHDAKGNGKHKQMAAGDESAPASTKSEGRKQEQEEEAAAAVWAEMNTLVDLLIGEALPSLLTRVGGCAHI